MNNGFDPATAVEKAYGALSPEIRDRLKAINFEQQVTVIPPAEGENKSGTFVPSRNFSDDLCYGVGFSYLGGLAIGSVWGAWHGSRMPLPTNALAVRYTTMLNQVTSKGPFVANRLGTIVTIYNIIRASLTEFGLNNSVSTLLGATVGGAIVRAPYGLRSAAVSSGLCGVSSIAWLALNNMNKK